MWEVDDVKDVNNLRDATMEVAFLDVTIVVDAFVCQFLHLAMDSMNRILKNIVMLKWMTSKM